MEACEEEEENEVVEEEEEIVEDQISLLWLFSHPVCTGGHICQDAVKPCAS